jgi:acetyl esterase/lipase
VGDGLTGHLMDIYLPADGEGPFPVIITIAGSAFFRNDTKGRAYELGKPLREHGFAIVAVNYRSSREAIFPALLHDIKAAVRFVRGNAEKYNLDTRFFGITGNSSGGHLSAMMGTTMDLDKFSLGGLTISLEGELGNYLSESSHVDAVVDWYGPTDFLVMDSCGSEMVHDAADSPESVLVGGAIQEHRVECALANPITYIDRGDTPFLIIHGDSDPLVPHCQSELLYESLQKSGVSSKLFVVPGGKHGPGVWTTPYIDEMVNFFKNQSKCLLIK